MTQYMIRILIQFIFHFARKPKDPMTEKEQQITGKIHQQGSLLKLGGSFGGFKNWKDS